VSAHHARLRRELPRIEEQLATVVRVHGDGHPQLRDLERLFVALAGELREHLRTEEASLFPAARALAAGERGDAGVLRLLDEHRAEHAAAGDALAALRELTNSYDSDTALCGTHRRLLEALEAFELDLHQHVHEENNLLFPRVLALASR
jgi:regulator of cell morphogenesis and NO signaling